MVSSRSKLLLRSIAMLVWFVVSMDSKVAMLVWLLLLVLDPATEDLQEMNGGKCLEPLKLKNRRGVSVSRE
ncbi:hypothetical protein BTUL_0002g00910 [Botrytis tulipae]|uniref:Uncharacterized protein n=1 Tax=Botrytis tulipae TaxID=87230 RepID=A0A4Z1F5V7_9HELO|nr:hypothetical protein BTUL_0002g00910 [Botrytis tulipae]